MVSRTNPLRRFELTRRAPSKRSRDAPRAPQRLWFLGNAGAGRRAHAARSQGRTPKSVKGRGRSALPGIPLGIKGSVRHHRMCAPPHAQKSSATSCRPTSHRDPRRLWRDGAVMLGSSTMTSGRPWASSNENLLLRPRWSIRGGREGFQYHTSCPARLIGRIAVGGGGAAMHGRDRGPDNRRLDPPAGGRFTAGPSA